MKIESRKLDIKAAPRIEAKNQAYVSRGGDKKVSEKQDSSQNLLVPNSRGDLDDD